MTRIDSHLTDDSKPLDENQLIAERREKLRALRAQGHRLPERLPPRRTRRRDAAARIRRQPTSEALEATAAVRWPSPAA